jgi:hypothetical protein
VDGSKRTPFTHRPRAGAPLATRPSFEGCPRSAREARGPWYVRREGGSFTAPSP